MARSKSTRKQSPEASELLLTELKEIYSAESQLARALPRLAKAVESESLKKMLDTRLEQGERLIDEIEKAFESMDASPGRKKNAAAEGLISEAREHSQEIERGPALDMVLIGAIQKTEHYCIAAWGTAKALAQATQTEQVARVMEQVLEEGKSFDQQLTELAESEICPSLLSMGEEMDSEEEDEGETRSTRSRKSSSSESRVSH